MALLTIDDAIAAFVACEPGDEAARRRLRERLWSLVADKRFAPPVRMSLADAIAVLDDPSEFKGDREAAGLEKVRNHLEIAVDHDENGDRAMSEPEPAPVPRDVTPMGIPVVPAPAAVGAPAAPATFTIGDDCDRALIEDFAAEAREYLENAEAALLRLETAPDDVEAINDVFRAFHTIKGTSSFLGLAAIAGFAHHAEDMLDRVRGADLAFAGQVPELSLRAVDILKSLVLSIPAALAGGAPPLPADYGALQQALSDPDSHGGVVPPRAVVEEDETEAPSASEGAPRAARAATTASANPAAPAAGVPVTDPMVKVRTDKLDRLVEMVGELVIANTILLQDGIVRDASHHDLAQKVRHADKIVRELQDLSLGLRMVPLKGAITKLARVVRDLANRSGKQIVFEVTGEETEVDRTLVDLLADPLLHMVRNAVDHGIEAPSERLKHGKSAMGVVRLEASQAGDRVLVKLRDDGRGLQREKIVAKAVEKGLIASGDGMSDSEVFDLIFAPGFSTAEAVTEVSGRGVGMDVVRRNLMAMRGRTLIESSPGKGSVFTIELPLTLAITDGMIVRVGAERFIVPTAQIRRCFRPEPSAVSTVQGKGEMVQHGGEVLPLLRLHRALRVLGAQERVVEGILMVVGDGNNRVAIMVDELLGQQQVVAKPLGEAIGRVRGLTGGAILGDGRVGLILDVDELVVASRQAVVDPAFATQAA
ncbi:MAG: chemotaxis protein CheA [Gemmatimonadetes bacterium]|jgi:two-component system chemotaxis sensor kinase CheA|nr:chemotaxis protein CheA [Gemmatimonadota bacterium]